MARVVLQTIVFFLMPFAAYMVYLIARQRYPFEVAAWTRATLGMLSIVGLLLAAAAIFGVALFADQHTGAYIPAHVEGGKLVPGRFE